MGVGLWIGRKVLIGMAAGHVLRTDVEGLIELGRCAFKQSAGLVPGASDTSQRSESHLRLGEADQVADSRLALVLPYQVNLVRNCFPTKHLRLRGF